MDVQQLAEGIRLLKLERGDRLAIHVPHDQTAEERDMMLDALMTIGEDWGVKFLVLDGDMELSVIREGD